MNKPQPLDLDLLEIHNRVVKDLLVKKDKNISRAIELTINKVKQRIKSACEFYLEWKDVPHIFCRAFPEYRNELRKVLGDLWMKWWLVSTSNNPPKAVWIIKLQYNEWLFKLAFGEILK